MKCFILLVLMFNSSVFCAIVGEITSIFNYTEINNTTELEELDAVKTIVTEALDHIIHMEEEMNITLPERNITWNTEASPLLSALRSFWTQARTGLLEPVEIPEDVVNNNEQIFKALEHGLIEATTMLMSQMEETSTPLSSTVTSETPSSIKRKGDFASESKERINLNLSLKTKRQASFEMVANISTSCSNCYEKLQSCVQKCFVDHNCNDVQRGVQACPAVPSRLCNPFTQWNPVDECISHSDCKSPLLCCNDGCVNKCLPGEWRL